MQANSAHLVTFPRNTSRSGGHLKVWIHIGLGVKRIGKNPNIWYFEYPRKKSSKSRLFSITGKRLIGWRRDFLSIPGLNELTKHKTSLPSQQIQYIVIQSNPHPQRISSIYHVCRTSYSTTSIVYTVHFAFPRVFLYSAFPAGQTVTHIDPVCNCLWIPLTL